MPKVVDEAKQRKKIRDAALHVFAERGMARTGLKHVATAAGMKRSNLYNYYDDKESLVRELTDRLLEEEAALFAKAKHASGSALERLIALASSALAFPTDNRNAARLIIQMWALEPERVEPFLQEIRESLAAVIREGQQKGEIRNGLKPEIGAALLMALIDGLWVQQSIQSEAIDDIGPLQVALTESIRSILASR